MPHPRRREQALDDALNILSVLADGAAVAADAASVPALKPVVSALSIVIKRGVRTNSETELAFYEKTKTLGEVIGDVVNEANTNSGRSSSTLQDKLNRLSRALTEIQVIAGGLKGGRGFRGRIKRFFFVERNTDTLMTMNAQLEHAKSMFSLGMQGATGNAVARLENMAINAEQRIAVEEIPHVDAGYLSVKEIKSGFMQGTRNDTFGTIKTWTSTESAEISEPIFLLTAGAGLGKSAVAHQLCVRLDDRQQWGLNLGASFFFSRGGIESAHTFFSTIAYQLALSQESLRPAILNATRAFLAGGKEQQVRRTFEHLLLKPLAAPVNGAVHQPTTFIVVDGMDECKDTDLVPELLRCLLELVRSVPWIRVLLATRPEPYILPVVTSQFAADIVYHWRLDDSQTMEESRESVGFYLRETIPKIHPYGGFVSAHPDKLNRLVERAAGLFIYARITVKYLATIDTRPEEQFDLLLSSTGAGLSPLDQLYLQILQSAFPPTTLQESPVRHSRVHDFLTFIALRRRSLPPAAISLLLALTDDDVLWMAGRLRAVLLVDRERNLAPLHATFAEFLVDSKRCIDPLYRVDPQKGHATLVRKCFASLNVDTATLYLKSQPGQRIDSQASVGRQAMTSWYSYFAHWDSHLNSLKPDGALQQDLHDMLQAQPIMTRVCGPLEIDIRAITRYVQDSKAAAEICREYINSRFYCELWWRKMKGDYKASQAASLTIAELEGKSNSYVNQHNLRNMGYSKLSIQPEDIERYTTVLQGLVDEIRESGTGELWYDLTIGEKIWSPL